MTGSARRHVTKRQLGWLLIAAGVAGIALTFLADLLGRAQYSGIGPAQRLILLTAAATVLIGLSLLPLGDRPA